MASAGGTRASADKSDYFRSLEGEVRKRYEEKISVIGFCDPYTIKTTDFSSQPEDLPQITYPDIVNYLVFTKSAYSLTEFKAYKSLSAYNHFLCGWVREVKSKKIQDHYVVTAKVLHSQRLSEKPLLPWLIVDSKQNILSAHCNCMAGLGESCSHIAAMLFYVDFAVRHREEKSVTSVPAYWCVPPVKEVPYAKMSDIDLSTPKRKYEVLEQEFEDRPPSCSSACSVDSAAVIPAQTAAELSTLFSKLHDSGCQSAILSLVPPFSDEFVPKEVACTLEEQKLAHLFREENLLLSLDELISLGRTLDIKVSCEECGEIEESTRDQANCQDWFSFRAGRITASRFKSCCKTKSITSAPSLVKAICYPMDSKFRSKATEWGCQHEKLAISAYKELLVKQHTSFVVKSAGFFINPQISYIGATPDAIVSCDCCGTGCLEIKCPYCLKDTSIEEHGNRASCLEGSSDGAFKLITSHAYYYQVQCHLFTTQLSYCDFVVWASKGVPHIERILKNQQFWDEEQPKATKFFQEAVLPELLGKYFTRTVQSVNPPSSNFDQPSTSHSSVEAEFEWCLCRTDKGGKMIMCDKSGCKILWYHMSCLNMKRVPKGRWICLNCMG